MSTDEKANEIIVETQYIQIPSIQLECGELLSSIQIAFETFGKLNSDKSNVILICHALTGDAHVTGKHSQEDKKPGWWHQFVGEGKAVDTNKYFVICSNVLGGCSGSTGPASINPLTGEQYALSFPFITIKDMVRAQKELIDNLGIEKILCCVGGSMGGMQALEWAITFPQQCLSYMILASTPFQSPQNIALNEVGRRAIMNDPNWHNGDYVAHSTQPSDGLSIARMIAHITYLSDQTMHQKFGRRIKGKDKLTFELQNEFEVESYLNYQGRSFIQRFDANSYLYITRAVDYFDYSEGKLAQILASNGIDSKTKFLIASFSSDWRCPPYQSREIVKALQNNNLPVTYREIESSSGHDSFLLETQILSPMISNFLENVSN